VQSAVARFTELVARPAREVDLGAAALAMAAGAYPDLDLAVQLRALDRLAAGVTGLDRLRARLFAELGLRGDAERYYDPDNSFLHRVLERRRGIPISLAVVMIEVGRRAGVLLQGVGMPGHFLVWAPVERVHLDPFAGGDIIDLERAEDLFRRATGSGPDVAFGPELLPVVDAHQILSRMLANLRAYYRASGSAADLEWTLRMRLALPSPTTTEAIELGEALAAQGRFPEGARELEARAATDPTSAAALTAAAMALRARLN
jgi:regulator of sirC expression with transglutaminase-like and TPR domain